MITGAVGIVLPGVPESVRAARQLVRSQLGDGHPAAGAAALAVSELATNAIAYTRSGLPGGTFAVSVQDVPGGVLIRVRDAGGRTMPVLADQAPGAEHGHGLRIVAALAAEWGTEPCTAGRATWCRIVNRLVNDHEPPRVRSEIQAGPDPDDREDWRALLKQIIRDGRRGGLCLPGPWAPRRFRQYLTLADLEASASNAAPAPAGDAPGDARHDGAGDAPGDAGVTLPGPLGATP
jgi:anti-sigma regulatory factor (Ser/Thr protein kinase)